MEHLTMLVNLVYSHLKRKSFSKTGATLGDAHRWVTSFTPNASNIRNVPASEQLDFVGKIKSKPILFSHNKI